MTMVKLHLQYLRNRILLYLGLTWRGKIRNILNFMSPFLNPIAELEADCYTVKYNVKW